MVGEAGDGGNNVLGGEGDVLDSGAAVELEVLLDLGLAPTLRRLVDRELVPPLAVGDDLLH